MEGRDGVESSNCMCVCVCVCEGIFCSGQMNIHLAMNYCQSCVPRADNLSIHITVVKMRAVCSGVRACVCGVCELTSQVSLKYLS